MKKLIEKLIEYFLPAYVLVYKKVHEHNNKCQQEIEDLKQEIEQGKAKNKILRSHLAKASSDNIVLLQRLAEVEEEAIEILPSRSVSFSKTVENMRKLSSKARTTLLFRITTEVLSDEEKQSVQRYLSHKPKEVNGIN